MNKKNNSEFYLFMSLLGLITGIENGIIGLNIFMWEYWLNTSLALAVCLTGFIKGMKEGADCEKTEKKD